MKILSILAKNSWKQKLNLSRCALFHMETRISLKHFGNGCRYSLFSLYQCRHQRATLLWAVVFILNQHTYAFTTKISSHTYSLGQNICRLSCLAQLRFTTSETELDYYRQKVIVGVVSQIAEPFKTLDLKELRNFKKIPEILGTESKCPASHPKANFWQLCQKIAKNQM